MLNSLKSLSDTVLTTLDKVFVAKQTEIDAESGLPFSYECVRCTWIRTLSVGILSGIGLEHTVDIINIIKGLFN